MTRRAITGPGLRLAPLLMAFASPVLADGLHVNVDAASIGANGSVSGFPSHQNFTTRQPGDGALLYGIRGGERNDRPCHFEFLWSRQNDNEHELFTTRWHREPCAADQNDDKEIRLSDPSPEQGIAAIQVCNNNRDNKRLKGIRITKAANILTSGSPHLSGDPRIEGKFERTNCAEWDKASTCPASHVAVGVNIYHDAEGATGLELICGLATLELPETSLQTALKPEGPALLSPLAGTAGTKLRVMIGTNVSLPNDPLRHYGITSVMIEASRDRPCRVVLFGGALDHDKGPDDRKLGEGKIAGCNPSVPIDTIHPILDEAPNHFLAAVEVWGSRSDANDRIKGLKLRAAHVREDARTTLEFVAQDTNPHARGNSGLMECPGWSSRIDGMIAVGLVMHHDGEAFTGIQLVCRDVLSVPYVSLNEDSYGY